MDRVVIAAERKFILEIGGKDYVVQIPSNQEVRDRILPFFEALEKPELNEETRGAADARLQALRDFILAVAPTLEPVAKDLLIEEMEQIATVVIRKIKGKGEASPDGQPT